MRRSALLLLASLAAAACGPTKALVADLFYDEISADAVEVRRDLAYRDTGDDKHRLDLYLPAPGADRGAWLVFAHGGGWTEGDRALTFGGEDLYGNVGRFFALRGIGTAVVSYRLMPGATWREQVADGAAALAFVQAEVARRGGDPGAVAVMGHSAGAWLAAHVALDAEARERAGARAPCGAILVSGAALDLTDAATWETGTEFGYYARRFSPSRAPLDGPPPTPFAWQVEASPASYASAGDPPASIVHADGEDALFETQAQALARALTAYAVPVEQRVMEAVTHEAGVFNLSKESAATNAALALIDRHCR